MKALRTIALAIALSLPLAATADDAKPAVTLTPYAMLHFASYWTGGTLAAQDFPAQASLTGPFSPPVSNGAYFSSARASRLGMRGTIEDGNWTGANISGFVEADFNAAHAGTASNAFHSAPLRLRFASVTATWKIPTGTVSVLAGQDWSVFNGLFAESIAWYATPIFSSAGNAYRRTPTMRLTYNGNFDVVALSVAVEAVDPVSSVATAVDNGPGNRSRQPDLGGRVGATVKPMADVSVMVAGSYTSGARRYNYLAATQKNVAVNALGFEVDVNATKYLQVKGEYYAAKGMDDAFAGIAPANIIGTAAQSYTAIRNTGYWGQAILKPIPEIFVTGGFGVDELNKDDLVKVAANGAQRLKNQQVEGGVIFNAGKNWRFGVEYAEVTSTYGGWGSVTKEERKASQIGLANWVRF